MDGSGGPLSTLPYPLSLPGSPRAHSTFLTGQLDVVHSAPPTQTTFRHFTFPMAQPLKQEQMQKSWPENTLRAIAVSKGSNALAVMGEPIQPLNSVDDGWDAVECGGSEVVDKHGHDLPGGPHALTERHASGGISPFSLLDALNHPYHNGESSSESSPPSFGQPTSPEESPDTEAPRLTLPPHIVQQHELHHPFPSYEHRSQLGDEMTKLLYDLGNLEGHAYTQAVHENGVQVAEQDTMSMKSHASSDGLISQYFNADAFDSKMHAGGNV